MACFLSKWLSHLRRTAVTACWRWLRIVNPQLLPCLVDLLVNLRDLFDPRLSLFVLHVEDLIERPMKVVSDVRYLLVQAIQGVAYDSPTPPPVSISNL